MTPSPRFRTVRGTTGPEWHRIASWDDPAWEQTDDPFRLVRALTVGMFLEVLGAAVLLVLIVAAFTVATLVIGAAA